MGTRTQCDLNHRNYTTGFSSNSLLVCFVIIQQSRHRVAWYRFSNFVIIVEFWPVNQYRIWASQYGHGETSVQHACLHTQNISPESEYFHCFDGKISWLIHVRQSLLQNGFIDFACYLDTCTHTSGPNGTVRHPTKLQLSPGQVRLLDDELSILFIIQLIPTR